MTGVNVSTHRVHVGVPADPGVRNSPPLKVSAVVCPDCKALVGALCVDTLGSSTYNYHKSRRRMATRLVNKSTDSRSADYVKSLSPAARRKIRESRGLTVENLGSFFGVDYGTFRRMELGTHRTPDMHLAAYGAWLRIWAASP